MCIHEAAHAVVHALGGASIYSLAVAPEGSTNWTYEHRKGGISTDLYGACAISDIFTPWLQWSEDELGYQIDKDALKLISNFYRTKGLLAEHRRQIRAHVCGLLAGPLADEIYDGEQDPFIVEPALKANQQKYKSIVPVIASGIS